MAFVPFKNHALNAMGKTDVQDVGTALDTMSINAQNVNSQ